MIPDPSTADTPVGEGGSGRPPRDDHSPPRGGHHCAICSQPLEESLRDMWVFAGQTSVAYLTCLFELMSE
jgi:hypothetical protein